jgi:hypothetical protein
VKSDLLNIYLEYSSQVTPGAAPTPSNSSTSYHTTQSMNGPGNGSHTLSDNSAGPSDGKGDLVKGFQRQSYGLIKKVELVKVINKLINQCETAKESYATEVLEQLRDTIKDLSA